MVKIQGGFTIPDNRSGNIRETVHNKINPKVTKIKVLQSILEEFPGDLIISFFQIYFKNHTTFPVLLARKECKISWVITIFSLVDHPGMKLL